MVAETARALWRRANPGRERLPKHFENRTRLYLRKIEEGSAIAPLEVYVDRPAQRDLFREVQPTEANEAIALAYQVFEAIDKGARLPETFPRDLLEEYTKWGVGLHHDEEMRVSTGGRKPVRVTAESSRRLEGFCDRPHQDHVQIDGQVLEADVRQKRFQLWLDDKTNIRIAFSSEQEDEVTTALKEHKTQRMKVKGLGEVSPQGTLLQVTEAYELEIYQAAEIPIDRTARPIEEVLRRLAKEVPQDEWDKLPRDLTDDLDHYVYGTPKR